MIAFLWWVTVNFSPVMGPWPEYYPCSRAAVDYSFGHHVFAICSWKDY